MHIKHTFHIRGPQPRVFFYREKLKYPSFSTATLFPFQEHFYVFIHGRIKITGKKKNRHSPHPESTLFNMQILYVYEITTGFSQLLFSYVWLFFAERDGFVQKVLWERERDLLCTETRGKKERGNVCSGWVCQKMYGEREIKVSRVERREEREVTCPFWIFVAGKDVEGSDPLQTRAFPVEGHVGFFWWRVGLPLDIFSVHPPPLPIILFPFHVKILKWHP